MPKDRTLQDCIRDIREAVEKNVWAANILPHYTDHGPDHSKRIIDVLDRLLIKDYDKFNDYERFILLASAYLHDIGMQSPTYAGIEKKTQYTPDDLEQIRKKHNESSAKMIAACICGELGFPLGLEGLEQEMDLANIIADVCKYHRSLDINQLKDDSHASTTIKVPLLAALLRLADELDADFRRININKLNVIDIPAESKYHWWAHHYVQSIPIKNGVIELYFRFPVELKGSYLLDVLRSKIVESIKAQVEEVYDILFKYGINLSLRVKVIKSEYLSKGSLKLIPDDLKIYIERIKSKYVPIIIAAMNKNELNELKRESYFRDLIEAFEKYEISNWDSGYGDLRDKWISRIYSEKTINEIITQMIGEINKSRTIICHEMVSEEFFAEDKETREKLWERIRGKNAVVIIDSLSLFHNTLRENLLKSGVINDSDMAKIILSPINSTEVNINNLIESFIRKNIPSMITEIDTEIGKNSVLSCGLGVGDIKIFCYWFYASLNVEKMEEKPRIENIKELQESIGYSAGIQDAIFG